MTSIADELKRLRESCIKSYHQTSQPLSFPERTGILRGQLIYTEYALRVIIEQLSGERISDPRLSDEVMKYPTEEE